MKKAKRWLACVLCLMMAAAMLTGCNGSKESKKKSDLDPKAVVLTVGEEKVPLQVAYFVLKWQQASYQSMATAVYGEEWYNQDLEGNGETFLDYIKSTVMDSLTDMYLCRQQAESLGVALSEEEQKNIGDAVKSYMKANSKDAQEAMMADEATVRTVLENYTLYSKVYNQVVKDADTSVSEEEARQGTYSWIYQDFTTTDEEGNQTEYTDAQKEKYYQTFESIAQAAKDSGDFDQAASDGGYEPSEHDYTIVSGGEDEEGLYVDINNIARGLQVGEVSGLIPVDGGLALIHLDTDNNEEATADMRQTMAQKKQTDFFEQWIAPLREQAAAKITDSLWNQIGFEKPIAAVTE